MKIPRGILQAPMDELMSGDLLQFFKLHGYGGHPLWTNTGVAFFVYIDKRTIRECKGAIHDVKLELHEIDGCPLIRFDIKIYDRIGDPLHFDAFLNINRPDQNHTPLLEALMVQEWMIFHWYEPNFKYSNSTGIHWPETQRQAAKQIIEQAKEITVRTGGGNFDSAKTQYMALNPLD